MINLPHKVTLKTGGELDVWGQPTQGRSVTKDARVDQRTRLVRDMNGKDVVSSAQIVLKGDVAVKYEDTLEWTDAFGNKYARKPLSIELLSDLSGKPLFVKVNV
jgi:hypothetical protein